MISQAHHGERLAGPFIGTHAVGPLPLERLQEAAHPGSHRVVPLGQAGPQLVELRTAVGDRIYGCDDCQEVCPPTVRLGAKVPAADPSASPTAWVDVLALLGADDEAVMSTWGRWYLADRDPRWVRRNALVVLGNSDAAEVAGSETVRQVLADYLRHHDPVLRAHAVWAAARLGLRHLMPASDPHPDVQRELVLAAESA